MGQIFNDAIASLIKDEIDYLNDDIYVALYTSSLTPNIDTQTYRSDISGEATGSGYTAGGKILASKTITVDDTNNRAVADAADVQWTGLTTSFRYLVVYKYTGTPATERLLAVHDLGSTQTIDGGVYDITWPASGVFYIQNV